MNEPIFDHEQLDVYRLSIFEIARGSALACAGSHDILFSFGAIDAETSYVGKSTWKPIVSILIPLIQLTEGVSEG